MDGKSERIKLLLFAPHGAGEHYHGAGTTFYRMYRHAKDALEITLVHGSRSQKPHECYEECVFLSEIGSAIPKQLSFMAAAKRWIRENHHRFDVLHGITAYHYAMVPTAYAQRIGLPSVVTVASHRGDLGGRANLLSRLLRMPQRRRKMAAGLSGMVATSQAIHEELREVGVPEEKIFRIPYGVNTNEFYPIERQQQVALRKKLEIRDVPSFVFVGGLVRRKRPMLILEAMARVKQEREIDFQTLFVGPPQDDEYKSEMDAFVEQHGLQDHVNWIGFQREVADYYRCADVFLLPSMAEGLPNAMLEAMACGLPAVGTPISGMTDMIVNDRNGFIIEPHVEELARAMMFFLDDEARRQRFGQESLTIARERFALDVVLPMYTELFRSVSKKH